MLKDNDLYNSPDNSEPKEVSLPKYSCHRKVIEIKDKDEEEALYNTCIQVTVLKDYLKRSLNNTVDFIVDLIMALY